MIGFAGSEEDAWHNQDFLPLPMSESYKLPSRKNRSRPQDPRHGPEDPQHRQDMLSHDKPGRWAHDKHAEDDSEDDPAESAPHADLRRQPGRVEQALLDAGLDSSDDIGEEAEQADQQEQRGHRKRKKTGGDWQDNKDVDGGRGAGESTQQGQGQGRSGDNPFGALIRGHAPRPNGSKPNRSVHL